MLVCWTCGSRGSTNAKTVCLIGVLMLARLFSFLANSVFAAVVAGFFIPGTHRVVLPQAFGLTEISPHVWTDAPGLADSLVQLVSRSRASVAEFFQDTPTNPALILCASRSCAEAFGIGGNGLSIADQVVMVSPGGLTIGTLTHELTHSRLHRSMGLRNLVRQPYPTWFDEGLATHVANHPLAANGVSNSARARVRQVERFWQWDDAFRDLGVGDTYAAARAEVAQIEHHAGRKGLLELIRRVEVGEDFDAVLREVTER